MIEFTLLNPMVAGEVLPDGVRRINAVDPESGIVVRFSLSEEHGKQLAAILLGNGLVVAGPNDMPRGQG